MYREWMATMERRVNNLQVTNEDLQVCLSFKKTKKGNCKNQFVDMVT